MKIIGLICFYDESVTDLTSCVVALHSAGVDHVIAVDGAYSLYPDGKPASDSRQHGAIMLACRQLGIGCTLHVPQGLWEGNEMEKRSLMFALGYVHSEEGDWYMVMDADQIISECPVDLRERLEATDLDAAEVTFTEQGTNYERRILFRAIPIFVTGNHFTYMTLGDRCLWAGQLTDQVEALDLRDLVVQHRPHLRRENRQTAKNSYYEIRDDLGVELTQCERCDERARVRLPTDWKLVGGKAVGNWVEVCKKCAKRIEYENDFKLRSFGADPEKVLIRYAHGKEPEIGKAK